MTCLSTFLLCLLFFQPVFGQQQRDKRKAQEDQQDLRLEIDSLKQSQQQILKELQEIKVILRSLQEGPATEAGNDRLKVAGEPFKGSRSARIVVIEYSDYECSFCGKYARETFPRVDEAYIKTGKVKYYYRDLPLPIHTHAFKAAEAAHCAGEQGRFWEMHARLFSNQNALAAGGLSQQAQALSLDLGKFDECLSSSKYAGLIRVSVAAAEKIKIDGTPAFLVGVADEAGEKIKIVRMMLGAQSYEDMKTVLDELLSSQPKESK